MKGFRFYLEYESKQKKRKGEHAGNCIAVPADETRSPDRTYMFRDSNSGWCIVCFSPLLFEPNSVVCGSAINLDILRERFKSVGEKVAREIHPNLFTYLEQT